MMNQKSNKNSNLLMIWKDNVKQKLIKKKKVPNKKETLEKTRRN